MSVETKNKKRKQQRQEQEQYEAGSTEYIANREVDQIIKKGRERIKHAINVSVEKLTRTKKAIVKEMAIELEGVGYPIDQICDRLSKSLKPLVHERTVRDALVSKYKNAEQSETAKMQQNHEGGNLYRQQQELLKKDVK